MYEVRGRAVLQLSARRQGRRRAHGLHRAALIVALASCGRLNFESRDDGGDGNGSAGSPISLALPSGGQMRDLAVSPVDDKVYVVAEGGAMYRLDSQWVPCAPRESVDSLHVDSTGAVFAASEFDVWRSSDQCASWSTTNAPSASLVVGSVGATTYMLGDTDLWEWNGSGWTLVVTPMSGRLLRAFDGHGPSGLRILGSEDDFMAVSSDGTNWNHEVVGFATSNVVDVGVAPARSYVLSGATDDGTGGVSSSFDGGATWSVCLVGGGTALALDPTDDQHVVVASYDQMGETPDAFASYALDLRSQGGMDDAIVRDLEFTSNGALYVASDRGAFSSVSRPIAWMPLLAGLMSWTIVDLYRTGDDVYASTSAGVLHSNAGMPFTLSTTGMTANTGASRIAIADDGTLIAPGRSIWTSTDKGATWTQAQPLDDNDGYYGEVAAVIGTRAFVGTLGRLHRADPPYTTWTVLTPTASPTFAIVGSSDELFLGTKSGVFRSPDAGESAASVGAGNSACFDLKMLSDLSIVAACDDGVWISNASRTSWTNSLVNIPLHEIALVDDGRIVVAGFSGGVFVTSNRGAAWTEITVPGNRNAVSALYDAADGTLVIGTYGDGLVKVALP